MLLLIGRRNELTAGNTYSPCPVMACSSRKITIAWRDSGTRCGRFIFMVSAGTVHTAFSKSISLHRASRNSPGRTNRSAESSRAALLVTALIEHMCDGRDSTGTARQEPSKGEGSTGPLGEKIRAGNAPRH